MGTRTDNYFVCFVFTAFCYLFLCSRKICKFYFNSSHHGPVCLYFQVCKYMALANLFTDYKLEMVHVHYVYHKQTRLFPLARSSAQMQLARRCLYIIRETRLAIIDTYICIF